MITKLHKLVIASMGKHFHHCRRKTFDLFCAVVVVVILGMLVCVCPVTFVRMVLFDINFSVRSCLMRVHTPIIVSSMTVTPLWLEPFALCCSLLFSPSPAQSAFVQKLFETKFLNFNLYIIKVSSVQYRFIHHITYPLFRNPYWAEKFRPETTKTIANESV